VFAILTDRRVLLSTVAIGGLLVVALWPRAVPVDLAPVTRGPLTVTIDAQAQTRVRERFVVAAPVTGHLLRLELEPGDRVKRGDSVARLRPLAPVLLDDRAHAEAVAALRSAEAVRGQARAEERRARTTLGYVQRELARSRHLNANGVETRDELDARETEVSRAMATATAAAFAVNAASAAVERAEARLETFVGEGRRDTVLITAPVDGVVMQRFRESEGMVSAGEPLVEIGDPWQLEIVTDLLSTDAVHVAVGADATIVGWGSDAALAATVRRVEPSGFTKISALGVEEQRVNVILDFADTGEDGASLGDAYRVDVRIVLWDAANVVKVPSSGLVRDGRRWAVYVAREGRARRTNIDVGRVSGPEAEVRSGLSEGETVIVHPSDLVRDGSRIVNRAQQ
jgi:HlyD family secretion protein